jgi:hypothetical protein
MTHYDAIILTILIVAGLTIFLGWALSSASWGKANQLVHQAIEELPQWDNPLYWGEMLPTKNCRECQQDQGEQEQVP